jgi:ubiquinone/menaquinone biosynthesis C-methylase UbiE
MACVVGEEGTVIAADVQEGMLSILRKSAEDQGLSSRFRFHQTESGSLNLPMPPVVSFALAFYVLHETVDRRAILADLYRIVRPGGLLLLAEPWIEVGRREFGETLEDSKRAGFVHLASPHVLLSRSALMQKRL